MESEHTKVETPEMDAMLANAINGLNAMPPKGLCMTCSDDDLRAVVEYIVHQSQ